MLNLIRPARLKGGDASGRVSSPSGALTKAGQSGFNRGALLGRTIVETNGPASLVPSHISRVPRIRRAGDWRHWDPP